MLGRAFVEIRFKDTSEGRAYYPHGHRGPGYRVDAAYEAVIRAELERWRWLIRAVIVTPSLIRALVGGPVLFMLAIGLFASGVTIWRFRGAAGALAIGLAPVEQPMTRADARLLAVRHTGMGWMILGVVCCGVMSALLAVSFLLAAILLRNGVLAGFCAVSVGVFGFLFQREFRMLRLKCADRRAQAAG